MGRWHWKFPWNIHLKFLFEEYYGEQIWPKRHNLTDNGTSYKLPQWRLAQEFSLEEFQQWKFQHHTPFLEENEKFFSLYSSFLLNFTVHKSYEKMFFCPQMWGELKILFNEFTHFYSSVPSHDTTSNVTLLPVCFNIATAVECFTFSKLCPSTASSLSPHPIHNKHN